MEPSAEREVIITSKGQVIDTVHSGESKEFYLGQRGKGRKVMKDAQTTEVEKQHIKLVYEELMKCSSCSVTLQHITYLDNEDHQKKEVDAYAVMQDGTLFYMTADEMKVVQKKQIITYSDGMVLHYQGKEPNKGYKLYTDQEGNIRVSLIPKVYDRTAFFMLTMNQLGIFLIINFVSICIINGYPHYPLHT